MKSPLNQKYKNRYRISSARLQTWDYSSMGAYYVTICTLYGTHFFGEVSHGKMQLTEIGKFAEQQWIKTPQLRPDMKLELDQFVVMPNHFHGIIIIGENQFNTASKLNQFGPQSKNLAAIIRGFKSAVTIQARKSGIIDFAWQSRYHDHIIHDTIEFYNIRNYIINNPANWNNDEYHN